LGIDARRYVRVPDPRGLVGGCRDDAGAIGRVGGGNDVIVMAGERGLRQWAAFVRRIG